MARVAEAVPAPAIQAAATVTAMRPVLVIFFTFRRRPVETVGATCSATSAARRIQCAPFARNAAFAWVCASVARARAPCVPAGGAGAFLGPTRVSKLEGGGPDSTGSTFAMNETIVTLSLAAVAVYFSFLNLHG